MAENKLPSSRNPIIPGFFPDPTICRQGDDYYVAHSTFEYFPGVPLWHSSDLIHWTQIANVLDSTQQFTPGHSAPSSGVYAPTLRYRNGRFWLITTDMSGDGSQMAVSATHPTGPWTEPLLFRTGGGIDPDLAWDDEGTCYLTFSTSSDEKSEISQVRVDLDTGEMLEEPRVIWGGTGAQWAEGPHLYHRGDWWYLLIAEGGTERGHCISVARARTPEGPFSGHPHNPIFTHRSTSHPVMSVGHGDMVETADGSWAMVYHGVRPRGYLPGHHVNGRETFLAAVDWVDDWPVIREDGFDVPRFDSSFVDDFSGDEADVRWVSPGAAITDIAEFDGRGVTLQAADAPNGSPSGLGFRPQDEYWSCAVVVAPEGTPALRLRYDDRHWYEVGLRDNVAHATLRIGGVEQDTAETAAVAPGDVTLQMEAVPSLTQGPDDIVLSVADARGTRTLARVDGRYLSTETAGGFVGRVLLAHGGSQGANILRVEYRAIDQD